MNAPAALTRRRFREGAALILLALTAILLQRSATTAWSGGQAPDGLRYEVSPIGVARFDSSGAAAGSCRWWPRLGDVALCEVADPSAFAWLRRAYPFTVLALWTSVLALFLNALRVPRRAPLVRLAFTTAVPALALLALWSLSATATAALTALAEVVIDPFAGGSGLVLTAIALSAVATGLLFTAREQSATAAGQAAPGGIGA